MINDLLEERGKNYGNFHTSSNLSQTLYSIILQHYNTVHTSENGKVAPLPNFMAESLQMICRKISRIANGNIYHLDSWTDIAGYATLVEDIIIEAQQRAIEAKEQASNVEEDSTDV